MKINNRDKWIAAKIAKKLLDREGVGAIWLLHTRGAQAYREGYLRSARLMMEIADTAELQWLARGRPGATG